MTQQLFADRIHRVSALVELGEGGAAVEAADLIPAPGLEMLRRERRANHLVDVARGYSQSGKNEAALTTLLHAEQFAPAEVRCRPMAVATINDLVRRSKSAPPTALTGHPVRSDYKAADDPAALPPPDALVVAPATTNTINKWAAGISDTLLLGLLVEGIGKKLPTVAMPFTNWAQAAHPAFEPNIVRLRSWGVTVLYGPDLN
jgi:hypothetical protein